MYIFRSIQKYFAIAGINSLQSLQVHPFNARSFIIITIFGLFSICSIIYLVYVANNLTEYADVIFRLSTLMVCASIYAILVRNMKKLFEIIDTFERIIDKRLIYPESRKIYEESNRNVEKWSQLVYFSAVEGSTATVPVLMFIIGYYRYFATDIGNDAFELLLQTWLPFDIKTPINYLMAIVTQSAIVYNTALMAICPITFTIGTSFMFISLTKDIRGDLCAINENLKIQINPSIITRQFIEFIRFHSDMIQLFIDIAVIVEPTFVVIFTWSFTSIFGSMLLIQMEISTDTNNYTLAILLYAMLWSNVVMFLYCEFGEGISDGFMEIGNVMDQLDWYQLPYEMWQVLLTVTTVTHKSFGFRGFGRASCAREIFKRVVTIGLRYYILSDAIRD